ncbi:glycoside hydrolase [Alicyclobacillus acidoterrestris]|uniref:Glycoside hydrolase n=1 Tax=Alicyclobacillus acidoterrestris (strain ATCC 49025 / DSM 3922 / CIP 106132 / NCIMB 13137 / GD3B) TaxID=1356854 RepID=T0DK07_ALIAG|nr:glycoside hydrolase [Alicyclobacillus acidoterrestris]EPZ51637.1 hypothetical protein N007_20755 [Alicyclobacillus acidoterrestris ATCC 49025]UNO50478.1 glycoside hydrolase [Alicyclobacillus acidoterrestris]
MAQKCLGSKVKFNSWFVDSDGDATFYEDYSKTHPATEQQQMNAIIQRLQFFDNQNMSSVPRRVTGFLHRLWTLRKEW